MSTINAPIRKKTTFIELSTPKIKKGTNENLPSLQTLSPTPYKKTFSLNFRNSSMRKSAFLSNAVKLKQKLTELQKFASKEGKKEYISMKVEEQKNQTLKEKMSNFMKKKRQTTKVYDQQNVLDIINKKNKRSKLEKQNNETKFKAKMEAFRKIATFIDITAAIKKLNIVEDEDFKEFLEANKISRVPSRQYKYNDESHPEEFSLMRSPRWRENISDEDYEDFEYITKPRHQYLVKKIHRYLQDQKAKKNKQEILGVGKKLIGALKSEEINDSPNDEFYDKLNIYLHNETLLISQNDNTLADPNIEAKFSEHKKNREAAKVLENYQAFKEIQEIKEILKKLGINIENNENQTIDQLYSANYTQQVDDFRKTLKNASLDVLRKNMEEFKESKKNVGERRNALAFKNDKYKKYAIMKNASLSMTSSLVMENSSSPFLMKNLTIDTQNSKDLEVKKSISPSMDDEALKRILELNPSKKKTAKDLPKLNLSHNNKYSESPLLAKDKTSIKEEFRFQKYQSYLNFVQDKLWLNGQNGENKANHQAIKFNLSRTFGWFVNDLEELERSNLFEKKTRDENFKNWNELPEKQTSNKIKRESSSIFSSFREEQLNGSMPLSLQRKIFKNK